MTENKTSILDPDDDAPDLSVGEWRERAQATVAERRTGRPTIPHAHRKVTTTIRLDPAVIAAFRALGPGWQTRINEVLRDWVAGHAA